MKIKCTPEKGTVKTNIVQRTIGRAVSVDTATPPLGPTTSDLLGDTFHCLYGLEFEPIKDEDVPWTRKINHALMKWLKSDEQFAQTRIHTSGKLILSLASSKTLYEYLMTDEAIREALKVQEETPPPPPMPAPSGLSAQGDGDSESPQEGDGNSGGEQSKEDKARQETQAKMDNALNRIEQLQNNVIGQQIISNAAKEAEKTSEKVEGVLNGWGIEPGDVNLSNLDEIMKLLDKNSHIMEKIAELAGRFEGICAKALEKVREAYLGQIVNVNRTQDFTLMFAPELCYLMSPDVPQLIHARYVSDFLSHGLLGFEMRAEGKELGSLYICVDGSGSMQGENGGFEVWAKAIALGLARALKKDKLSEKEYKLSTFGSSSDPFFETNSNESFADHFTWAEKMQGGGTDFSKAFRHAISELRNMPAGTDFVFITDGRCNLSPEEESAWKKYKDESGTRLLYVDVFMTPNEQLRKLSDLYMQVKLDKDGNMDMIAETIADTLASSIERARLAKLEEEEGESP